MDSVMQWVNKSVWRRYGTFYVTDAERTEERIEALFTVMRCFLVMKAEYDPCMQATKYLAMSPLFDEVPEGKRAPEYKVLVTRVDNLVSNVNCERLTHESS